MKTFLSGNERTKRREGEQGGGREREGADRERKRRGRSLGESMGLALCLGRLSPPLELVEHAAEELGGRVRIGRDAILVEGLGDEGEGADARDGEATQLRGEGTEGHGSAAATPLPDGVRHDPGRLERVLAAAKVVHEVGEGRGDGVVVLGGDNDEAVGGFDHLRHRLQLHRRLAGFVVEVGLVEEREFDLERVQDGDIVLDGSVALRQHGEDVFENACAIALALVPRRPPCPRRPHKHHRLQRHCSASHCLLVCYFPSVDGIERVREREKEE
jgi:hypothetical protein